MINFKNDADKVYFSELHPKLKTVVAFMINYCQIVLNHTLTITRIYEDDGSTHASKPPYRFIDIRSKDFPSREEAEKLRKLVNITFDYGLTSKGLPGETIVPFDHSGTSPGFTGEHFHVQVSSRVNFG